MAAWTDEAGRLLRFHLRAEGAAAVDPHAIHDPARLDAVQRQVTDYCEGRRRDFDLALAPEGPEFELSVWRALCAIPFGTTTSYGAIARAIGQPGAARAVGAANNANPIALVIPCHRVIGADGQLVG
jgi:methylated-DNA-[protein]-cysteine S-methyltransferase